MFYSFIFLAFCGLPVDVTHPENNDAHNHRLCAS